MVRRLLALVALAWTGCAHLANEPRPLIVRAFDIGYGDAILVSQGRSHILFDTGPADAAPALLQKLEAAGVKELTAVVISHSHPDHLGGLKGLVDARFPIGAVFHDPATDLSGFESLRGKMEPLWPLGVDRKIEGLRLRFLHPAPGRRFDDPNNGSLVTLVQAAGQSVLMTGDLVSVEEQESLCPLLPERLWILKAPHHGDHMADCLTQRAEQILVSVAENPWGVPRPEVVARHGAKLRRTDVEGDVTLSSASPRSR